jgi:UDP-GlcNAc:undecaprenyl-phosphate GlcNAc-1-phosphate transferase
MREQFSASALAAFTSFGVTFLLTPLIRSVAVRFSWITPPAQDRWGRRVIPRLGGAAMALGFLAAALVWVRSERGLLSLFAGLALISVVGLVDDVRKLPANTKLIAQLLIGCLVVLGGSRISLPQWTWLAIPLSVMWFVLVMNAFNLLDNMDGLAAGIGAIAAGFCAVHAALAQQWTVMALNAALCGSCLGFLRFNFPPAKIYMGDSGSHFIGLSLAALSLAGTWRHSTQLLSVLAVPTLVLAVPIFDTCFVTIQRLLHRQHPFVGGTDHISHRLAILGLSTRQSVMALYGVSASLGLLSVITANLNAPTTFAIWLLVVTALALFGRYLARVKVYRLAEKSPEPTLVTSEAVGRVTLIETMLVHKRRLLEIVIDFCLLSLAYVFAHLLRFEGVLSEDLQQLILRSLPVILVAKLSCLGGFGIYRGVWRYVGLPDFITIFKAITLSSVLSACALLYLWRFQGFSRAVFIIDWMLSILFVGGARVTERLLDEWIHAATGRGSLVLIIGAGDTGARVLRSLRYEGPTRYQVIGFLDDDVTKWGNRIQGAAVLGPRTRLAEVIQAQGVQEVFIAIGDPPGDLLEYVRDRCEANGIVWRVVTAGVTSPA